MFGRRVIDRGRKLREVRRETSRSSEGNIGPQRQHGSVHRQSPPVRQKGEAGERGSSLLLFTISHPLLAIHYSLLAIRYSLLSYGQFVDEVGSSGELLYNK